MELPRSAIRDGNRAEMANSGFGDILHHFPFGFLPLCPITVAMLRLLFRQNRGLGDAAGNGHETRSENLKRKLRE